MSLTANSVSVVIADAQPLFALGVTNFLEREADIAVVGSVRTEAEAAQSIVENRPDIILLDTALPGLSSVGVGHWLAGCEASTRAILLSVHEDGTYAQQALASGAYGFVLKQSAPEVLLHAIRATLAGGVYLDPTAVAKLISGGRPAMLPACSGQTPVVRLTNREREVFRLIAFGFTNKEIAFRLGITSKSVETYKMRASEKLQIRTRAKIVQYALLQGWLRDMAE